MSLRIAVCDDVDCDRQLLISLIKAENETCECTPYDSGETLLWDFEDGTHFDIFFLDIFMKGISGVETAKRIRAVNSNALIIFVSSSDDFYRESYDLYAFNYLLKPLKENKLTEVLRRAIAELNKDANQVVHFSFDNSLHTIPCSHILYLTSDKHIVYFHLTNGKTLKSYGKIDDFITQLSSKVFFRCHQSYIVNLKHVTGLTTSEFILGETRVPISRKYSSQAREQYRIQMFNDF
jgi:DNA-binding LytR/AlgR family response regulator